jgi:hypothetical protein
MINHHYKGEGREMKNKPARSHVAQTLANGWAIVKETTITGRVVFVLYKQWAEGTGWFVQAAVKPADLIERYKFEVDAGRAA